MSQFGYHASHEQFAPGELLDLTQAAERAGFGSVMCSDHFAPWSSRQGHSGHAWVWLGAAMALTSVPMGVVTAPGQRYHPAVLAQAAASLTQMYPGRFWLALGSGQALNEHITGEPWPRKDVRMRRLADCVAVIRALFAGETVSHEGLVRVDRARLWSRPDTPPLMVGAAVTPETAAWAADWADGLITINQPGDAQADTLSAYRNAGGTGPAVIQTHLSWTPDQQSAQRAAHDQWREAIFGSGLGWDVALPEQFEQAAQFVRPGDVEPFVHVSAELPAHSEWLAKQAGFGFDQVMIHQVGTDQHRFIEEFGEHVLPGLVG